MSTEQLPDGLQLAVNIIREAEWPEGAGGNPLDAVLNEHAQRLTLQHHACDMAQRVADLEAERDEWKRIASAYSTQKELSTALEQAKASRRQARKERDTLRAKYDELLVALHGIGAALGIPEGDRSPYSVTCGVLERVNRPAEIEAQEPLFYYRPIKGGSMYEGPHWAKSVGGQMLREDKPGEWKPLYARPVPAQAVPDGCGACGDGCAKRGSCRLADESPEAARCVDVDRRGNGRSTGAQGMTTIDKIMEMIHRWADAADDHLDGALFLTIKSAIDTGDAEIERLRARLAEIEAQEPVAISKAGNLFWAGNPQDWRGVDCSLYATHVPAQAVPDADGVRFRWLCEDHSDRETRERCRSLIDRLSVMSYSDALMSIDAAMAAAPEHKA